jgi:group I intron endonuclease
MIGIYKITNPNGKIYIGQSVNIKERKLQYKYLSKYSLGRKIYNSLKKYGWEQHIFEIIEECSLEQLDEREIYWGGHFNVLENGLNLKLGDGRGICSEETKRLMSKSAKNIMTEEHRNKLSIAKLGKSRTEEAKRALRVPKKSKENYKNTGKWVKSLTCVLQYDLEEKFIKEWSSIKEAEVFHHPKNASKNNISGCCSGRQKTAYGYIWKYKI